ncbi:MAG: hypothetical protein ACR2QH_00565, partial [Geminicoccaceae bacterium]
MSATHQDIEATSARRRFIGIGIVRTVAALSALILISGCDQEKLDQVTSDIGEAFSGVAKGIRGDDSQTDDKSGAPPNEAEVRTREVFTAIKDNWAPDEKDVPEKTLSAHEKKVEIAGYTAAYQGVRAQTRTGALELALDELDKLSVAPPPEEVEPAAGPTNVAYTKEEAPAPLDYQGFKGEDRVHLLIERGALLLEKGDLEAAVVAFEDAEQTLKIRAQRSYTGDAATDAKSFLGSVFSGDGEFGPYNLQPYEEVLFLNYKTIGYLLQGRSEAYNVGRRAADRQSELHANFIKMIEQAKA